MTSTSRMDLDVVHGSCGVTGNHAALPSRATGAPVCRCSRVAEAVLRELRSSDAPALLAALGSPEVTRLISPPPPTVDGLREVHRVDAAPARSRSVVRARRSRSRTRTPSSASSRSARCSPAFDIAEWGFALGSDFWGTGMFHGRRRSSCSISRSMFSACTASRRARRSRTAAATARCTSSARCRKRVLRRSFLRNGVYLDQALLDDPRATTWRERRPGPRRRRARSLDRPPSGG